MLKYRKKPVVIEAIQFTGTEESAREISNFAGKSETNEPIIDWITDNGVILNMLVHTLEGDMKVSNLDFVIKGVNGECYPCKPDIFEKTYEKVGE